MRASFLLLLLCVPAFAGSVEYKCATADPLTLGFREVDARAACTKAATPDQCSNTVEMLLHANNKLEEARKASCDNLDTITQDLADAGQQADSYKQISGIAAQALADSNEYLKQLKAYYEQIRSGLLKPTGPLALPTGAVATAAPDLDEKEKQHIREALTSSDKIKRIGALSPASTLSDIQGSVNREDASLFAAVNGANYMKKILAETDEVSKRISGLNGIKLQADNRLKDLGDNNKDPSDKTPKNNPSSVSEGSGLDMKTLAGLASAGAALAPLLQKKDAPNNADNSASTSPTPGSTNDPAAKSPESSKLGDDKAPSQPPIAGTNPKKDDPATPARVPSGSAFHDASDVSHSYGAFGGGATGASTGAAPARAGAGGSGGSFGGFGGDGAADPAAAAAKAAAGPAGDDTQGIGGGNLGGGGPPSLGGAPMGPGADPTAAAAANPEDSMKDLLHEMKETAEGANSPNVQASNADIPMTDEDLFPRVRNAYVRALKQGRILDSLAEKVTEENQ